MSLPVLCPSCQNPLSVTRLQCNSCDTEVCGHYLLPWFLQLSVEYQQFLLDFVICSGSIKEMAHKHHVSYPTMRNKLDDLIALIHKINISNENKEAT